MPVAAAPAAARRGAPLTAREREVLRLMALGRSDGEIAGVLDIGVWCVERRVAGICDKLGASGTAARAAAVAYATRTGLVPHEAATGRTPPPAP